MFRLIAFCFLLTSCSMGVVKTGGEHRYRYQQDIAYSSKDLKELAPEIVITSKRDPKVGKLDQLFGPKLPPLKKVGIIIFETVIQPTRGGLAGQNKIYLTEQGKQLLTENLLNIWEQSFPIIGNQLDYVATAKIKKSKSLHNYGFQVDDHVKSHRTSLSYNDIYFAEAGKKTATATVFNARGMRDMSFALVPAYELMGGPKWSEHNKHFLNDVMRELKLDAAIIVMSELSWTAAHKDKHSGENFTDQANIKISSSILLPLSAYNDRLKKIGIKEPGDATLCYRAYEAGMNVPLNFKVLEKDSSFEAIESELLSPVLKVYRDVALMTIHTMTGDLKKTF